MLMRSSDNTESMSSIGLRFTALLSQFSLLAEFFIEKGLVEDRDSRVLKLVNVNPGLRNKIKICALFKGTLFRSHPIGVNSHRHYNLDISLGKLKGN